MADLWTMEIVKSDNSRASIVQFRRNTDKIPKRLQIEGYDSPVFQFSGPGDTNTVEVYKTDYEGSKSKNQLPLVLPVNEKEFPKGSQIKISDKKIEIVPPKVKLASIDVYKEVDDKDEWTLKSASASDLTAPGTTTYHTIKIRRDTTRFGKKLKFPTNQPWYLFVEMPQFNFPAQLIKHVLPKEIMVLDEQGKVTFRKKGEEPKYSK